MSFIRILFRLRHLAITATLLLAGNSPGHADTILYAFIDPGRPAGEITGFTAALPRIAAELGDRGRQSVIIHVAGLRQGIIAARSSNPDDIAQAAAQARLLATTPGIDRGAVSLAEDLGRIGTRLQAANASAARTTIVMLHDLDLVMPGGFSSAGFALGDGFFSQGPLADAWFNTSTAGAWRDADVVVLTGYAPLGLRRAKQQSWAGGFGKLSARLRYLGPSYWIGNSTLTPVPAYLALAIRREAGPMIPSRPVANTASLQIISPDGVPQSAGVNLGR